MRTEIEDWISHIPKTLAKDRRIASIVNSFIEKFVME
jgi:hypothetical protein